MVQRYMRLKGIGQLEVIFIINFKEFIAELQLTQDSLMVLRLSSAEEKKLGSLEGEMAKLHSITLALQKNSLTCAEVRGFFDKGTYFTTTIIVLIFF